MIKVKTKSGSVYTIRKEGRKLFLTRMGKKEVRDAYSDSLKYFSSTKEMEFELRYLPKLELGERVIFKSKNHLDEIDGDGIETSPIVSIEGKL